MARSGLLDGDRVHDWTEFAGLDWVLLDPERFGKDWSIGRGGNGFGERSWSVSVYHDDDTTDIWEVPPALSAAIDAIKGCAADTGKREVRMAIISALGLEI